MSNPKRPKKLRVKKIKLAPGEVASVVVPKGHAHIVAAVPEERRVEVAAYPLDPIDEDTEHNEDMRDLRPWWRKLFDY